MSIRRERRSTHVQWYEFTPEQNHCRFKKNLDKSIGVHFVFEIIESYNSTVSKQEPGFMQKEAKGPKEYSDRTQELRNMNGYAAGGEQDKLNEPRASLRYY